MLRFALITCVTLVAVAGSIHATTVHVPADQPTIQAGIDAGSTGDTVLVADGLYSGLGNRDIDFKGKKIVLRSITGASTTTIDCQGSALDPHRAFNFHSHEDTSAKVEGFTLSGGYGLNDTPGGFTVGGAIRCDTSSSPTIRDCIIYGNTAHSGGGVYSGKSSYPRLRSCVIRKNTASFGGGVVALTANLYLDHCVLDSNIADSGGAVAGYVVHVVAKGCSITHNSILHSSGGGVKLNMGNIQMDSCEISYNFTPPYSTGHFSAYAGGMDPVQISYGAPSSLTNCTFQGDSAIVGGGLCIDTTSNIEVRNCRFIENFAFGAGGGLACNGAATIKGCLFQGNRAGNIDFGYGGGMRLYGKTIVDSCKFLRNWTESEGGAIRCQDSSPTITNCSFIENQSNDVGAGIGCYQNSPFISRCTFISNDGGALFAYHYSNPEVTNCTMFANFSHGTAASHVFCFYRSRPIIHHSILAYGPQNPAIYCRNDQSNDPDSSYVTMLCCDVYGNVDGDWVGCLQSQLGHNGNVSSDPIFCDTAADNLYLRSDSPCSAARSACNQLVGAFDIGCSCCLGTSGNVDCDINHGVDISDLSALIDRLYISFAPLCCDAEANVDGSSDGNIDISDLTALIDYLYIRFTPPAPCL